MPAEPILRPERDTAAAALRRLGASLARSAA
jgi:hypothetical protein